MARLTVEEASETYASAMRNVLPAGPGVCATCHAFVDPGWARCYACSQRPGELDLVVPITYSEHLGQVHHALRNYKDGYGAAKSFARPRVAAILWRFLEHHERCVAEAAGTGRFEIVTTVPSSRKERDDDGPLRTITGWCKPVADRLERLLIPTGTVTEGREYDPGRYSAVRALEGRTVLLIDDTWTAGGHAQSAATALRDAGAGSVALIVIGRHVRPEWPVGDTTCGEILSELPGFDWSRCCVHG